MQEDAESGCHIDWSTKSRDGPDCEKLDSFESFVRQLLGSSPMSSFAHLLYTLRKGEIASASRDQEGTELAFFPDPNRFSLPCYQRSGAPPCSDDHSAILWVRGG